jgi:hypothetical protein
MTVSIQDRYIAALTDVRLNSDVLVFDNYPACCGSCAGSEIEQKLPDAHYVYFMNEQGRGVTFKDGNPWNFESADDQRPYRPAQHIYFNHSDLHAATVLRDALEKFGLPVKWDGTDGRCVELDFTA